MNTIKVNIEGHPLNPVMINEEDFDEAVHELYNEEAEAVGYDRESLKAEAVKLELEFSANIGNKKLFELIEAKKAELNA